MDYAALIKKLQLLSKAKQIKVFDFIEFLVIRNQLERSQEKTLADSPLAELIRNPLQVDDFTPLSREEANAH